MSNEADSPFPDYSPQQVAAKRRAMRPLRDAVDSGDEAADRSMVFAMTEFYGLVKTG